MRYLTAILLMVAMTCLIGCADDTAQVTPTKPVKPTGKTKATAPQPDGGPTIGEPAPEIVGVDLEGVEFKLSDYRGKVVMLDFYGDW